MGSLRQTLCVISSPGIAGIGECFASGDNEGEWGQQLLIFYSGMSFVFQLTIVHSL